MEMLTQNFPWLAGLGGGIAIFWNHLKSIFFQLKSIVIVSHDFTDEGSWMLRDILLKKGKTIKFQPMTIHSFVFTSPQTKERITKFHKGVYPFILFIKGFPIFIKGTTISYLRGTVSDSFISDLEKDISSRRCHNDRFVSNFYIQDLYGKLNDKQIMSSKEAPSSGELAQENPTSVSSMDTYDFLTTSKSEIAKILKYENDMSEYGDDVLIQYKMLTHWLDNKKWFNKRKIPWNRSIRIEGVPGSGKSTFIHKMAVNFGIPIFKFQLSTMDNKDFTEAWKTLGKKSPCIALFEDFDRVFNDKQELILEKLTLDCILNCVSGVNESDGILTIITANFPERLDPALGQIVNGKSTRPGRLDFVMTINELSEKGRRIIANNILDTFPEVVEDVIRSGEGETAAQFSQRCIELAQNKFYDDGLKRFK